ncbi:MAG: TIR domain-containing protein [Gammaproteobacteria bacterium]|nr:MAG: TIR domain-containing protein [Gammaproteobacteria bacterium]
MEKPFSAYKGSEPYVFVCYAHKDEAAVYPEIKWLHEQGINVWYDEGVEPGTIWRSEIGEAVENAAHVLFYISNNSLTSDHCSREINYALDQSRNILPVYLEEVDLTADLRMGLGRVQAIFAGELSTIEYRAKLLTAFQSNQLPTTNSLPESTNEKKTFRKTIPLTVTMFVFVAVGAWWYQSDTPNRDADIADRTIAVLPFETLGADKANAFTEGIHLGVLTRLANVSDLAVISRTSVMAYRITDKTLPQIARELKVSWVVRADVQQVGGEVQINARLVDAVRDRAVWAKEYRRTLSAENIFDIQADVSKSIIVALQVQLSSFELERVEQIPTDNLEAYRLYLLGRNALDERSKEGMQQAADYFQQAIDEDASYALAWTGLADALSLYHDYGFEETGNKLLQAEQAIRHALLLDSDLAETHASYGLLLSNRNQGPAAVKELSQAIELRPSYAEAHNWLGWVHLLLGHPQEGLESTTRAVALDPLSGEAVSNLALAYLAIGKHEIALSEARRVEDTLPSWPTGKLYEGLALYHLARLTEAHSVLQHLSVPWTDSGASAAQALVLVATGDLFEARVRLAQIEQTDDLFSAGLIYAALGETDRAFAVFERIDQWRAWPTLAMRYYFPNVLSPVRNDVRYQKLLREIDRSWGISG